jgi:4-amino-4-deoxy-L-arabinose transferase-like glycosyltransferase
VSTALLEPLHQSPSEPAADIRRRRWEVWRSPAGQPPWARPALLVIAAIAAFLYAWNITNAGLAPFYSVAVKSMSESWKAFFFGAFDPKATITIDKLAGSFLPQALSARLFGFHPWSLALPQVIEGVIAVLAMYRVVRRWAGVLPGLLAALLFTLTPIAASVFGHSMEDGALTMCLVLAADAYQRAVLEGRLRSLIWSGVWVGLGFQAKMLQAWIVLPALVIGYLLCAPPRLRRRLWQLGVFAAVTAAVSLSWVLLYALTPAGDRPYVDGSTNNSAFAMVFGYNGLERFGVPVSGAVDSGPGVTAGGGGFGARAAGGFGTGWTKLLGSSYGPQIGWLYPLAVLALVCGLLWTWRARRADPVRGGFVLWGLWLLAFGLVFSKMSTIPHTAYMASLAPPLAALSGAGIVMFWRAYRAGGRRGWMLPAAAAVSLAWAVFLWRSYTGFLPWALDAAVAVGAAGVIIMVAARLAHGTRSRGTRFLAAGIALGVVAAVFAAPATWAASVLDTKYGGSSFNASAGPGSNEGFGGGGGHLASSSPGGGVPSAPGAPASTGTGSGQPGGRFPGGGSFRRRHGTGRGAGGGFGGRGTGGFGGGAGGGAGIQGSTSSLTAAERDVYDYVSAHRDGAGYLMAVTSWTEASPYILATGQEVMPMGGFSGTVPAPTLAGVRKLVSSGQLRFFLLGGSGGAGNRGGGTSAVATVESWVQSACAKVPAKDYGGTSTTSAETLYECSR